MVCAACTPAIGTIAVAPPLFTRNWTSPVGTFASEKWPAASSGAVIDVPATPTVTLAEEFRTLPVIVAAVASVAPLAVVGAPGVLPWSPQAAVETTADINMTNTNFCIDDPPGVPRTIPARRQT
jgi:hypothetical protein